MSKEYKGKDTMGAIKKGKDTTGAIKNHKLVKQIIPWPKNKTMK